jgi:hypothetical protein
MQISSVSLIAFTKRIYDLGKDCISDTAPLAIKTELEHLPQPILAL